MGAGALGEARACMIDRREILDMAERMSLLPNIVEKDYVLGWMLAGIYAHDEIKDNWVFKGGTCLKKCFFETYRFSEDLDFTLTDASHLDAAFLKRVFGEIGQWIYDQTGIEVPANSQAFDIYQNPRGSVSCEGKISYRGPVSPPSMPRIKLDTHGGRAPGACAGVGFNLPSLFRCAGRRNDCACLCVRGSVCREDEGAR